VVTDSANEQQLTKVASHCFIANEIISFVKLCLLITKTEMPSPCIIQFKNGFNAKKYFKQYFYL